MGLCLAMFSSAGWAQGVTAYQCSADGRSWISRTPCPAVATAGSSAECARIRDALRGATSRSMPYRVAADLRAEYQRKCQEEDREARQRAYEDQQRERKERMAAKDTDRAVMAENARQTAQCDEMLRSLAARKRRIDTLTPGERDDLARFQARYEERCKR